METEIHPLAHFNQLLRDLLSDETETSEKTLLVRYAPEQVIALRREALTKENKVRFVKVLGELVSNLDQPHSYRTMIECAGRGKCSGVHLSFPQARAAIAIGRAFQLWNIIPVDVVDPESWDEIFRKDVEGNFPAHSGLGNFHPEHRGSLEVLH